MDEELQSYIGTPTGKSTVVVERGPVMNFAKAVTDDNPVFYDPRVAQEQGFESVPAPPTFGFAAGTWGTFPELQPEDDGGSGGGSMGVLGLLMQRGGGILHGEQEFEYQRPILVGDVLHSEGRIADIYEKEGRSGHMTFVVIENEYRDEQGGLVLTARNTFLHRQPKSG